MRGKTLWIMTGFAALLGILAMACVSSRADAQAVGEWYFEEGAGQIAVDSSGNGNNGTLGSTPGNDSNDPSWTTSGLVGNALDFDGADDYVNVSDLPALDFGTGNFTLAT